MSESETGSRPDLTAAKEHGDAPGTSDRRPIDVDDEVVPELRNTSAKPSKRVLSVADEAVSGPDTPAAKRFKKPSAVYERANPTAHRHLQYRPAIHPGRAGPRFTAEQMMDQRERCYRMLDGIPPGPRNDVMCAAIFNAVQVMGVDLMPYVESEVQMYKSYFQQRYTSYQHLLGIDSAAAPQSTWHHGLGGRQIAAARGVRTHPGRVMGPSPSTAQYNARSASE